MPMRDAVAQVDPLVVRPAMHHRAAHGANLVFENGAIIPANDPGNATHESSPYSVELAAEAATASRTAADRAHVPGCRRSRSIGPNESSA